MGHSSHTTHLNLSSIPKVNGLWQNSSCLNWRKVINDNITIPLSKKYHMAIVKHSKLRAVPTSQQLNHALLLISLGKQHLFHILPYTSLETKKYRMAIVKHSKLRVIPTSLQLNNSLLLISLGKQHIS